MLTANIAERFCADFLHFPHGVMIGLLKVALIVHKQNTRGNYEGSSKAIILLLSHLETEYNYH